MRKSSVWQCSILFLASLVLSGCVTVPDSIKGHSESPQQDLARVLTAPALFTGQESRFGGKVVKVDNRNGMTRLEIAAMPLDAGARPMLGTPSIGRIFADVNGFIDPIDFNQQMVTVVGTISGTEKGKVGEAQYNFLVIKVTGYQRWHMTQQIVAPPQPIDPWIWYGPGYGHHRGGYWGPPPFGFYNTGPAQVQTILTQ